MEFLSGLLSCSLWPLLCTSLGKQYNYIRKLKEHKEILQNELERLKSRGNDINDELKSGRLQHGKNPKKEVTLWLEDWQKLVNAIENMDTENGNGMCLRGLCLNCYSRLKQSKRIEKLISDVKGLLENGRFTDGLFSASLPENQDSLPATDIQGSTAERKRVEILQCIMDPEVSKIGVYGMGGVGKTTIMTNIYNQLKETREFDIVIWVTVSSFFNLDKLQDIIAKQLGCDLSSPVDETSRAMGLHAAFRRRRNFLIIFDDMWNKVSLQDLGIPEPNRENRSKILWTTRSIRVCNSMESQREIKVEGLYKEEAWSLFKDKVGGEDVISPEIESIAKEVAEECGGLPLALITVGRALRKTHQLEVWRSALQELRSSSTDQIEGMEEEVFRRLKFSYNRLNNDKLRECFLYCALYPEDEDIDVDELIKHWMAEGLIVEAGSWEREKDKGHAILKELKDACMIETGESDENYVRMHDLIRDLAIIITREQSRFMVKAGLWLNKSSKEEEWAESLERVSLMESKIKTLHGKPNCPRLLTLFLQQNRNLNNISDTFFKQMHNLRVLNLSATKIKSLPDALSDMTNLHALLLQSCKKLKCLPSLAKLHKLRVLDLNRVPLEEVPHGLENLVKLRYLDISKGERLRSFPSGILSKCTNLEHLLVIRSGWRWPYSNEDDKDKATVAEIISLENLTLLSAEFSDVRSFNRYSKSGRWKYLKNSEFGIGGSGGFGLHEHAMCLQDSDLENVSGVILPSITHSLIITKCDAMEWMEEGGDIGFPNLQQLQLRGLPNFRGLCKQKTQQETFRNLRVLDIYDCNQLKWLITIDLLQNNLQNLQFIDVHRCKGMKEIISCETGLATIILPKLEKLSMFDLPVLTSVCPGKLVCDSLSMISVIECPNMRKLPFSIDKVPPALKSITGTREWCNSLEWDDPHLEQLLQPFLKFR
ncbi:hypothetical protein J5N97_008466 [Dioscorea zingiberensis]|uniref:NB-ARC domain-containing protein n=1 Tax=Dioscorea zingiberensis TaxID=325984 RepID=A0A9D5CUX9_9LILI|nr:hypothetical protein J5N97_008466 [Dioscorea zingiberensis]